MGSFSVFHWFILAVIAYVLYRVFAVGGSGGKVLYCTTCGSEGPAKTVTKGSILIEIVLWLAFIIPGVIYSIWRMTTRHQACSQCGASTLVPPSSPMAVAQKKKLAEG